MNWKTPRPALEIGAEMLAAASLGGAVGFALWRLAPMTGAIGVAGAIAAGAIAAGAELLLAARIDRRTSAAIPFEPVAIGAGEADEDVLLLDQPEPADGDELLLDQPMVAEESESRVIQLFGATTKKRGDSAGPLPDAGEMAARIEDFLRPSRGHGAMPVTRISTPARPVDASEALHAALADIRRSLRQQ